MRKLILALIMMLIMIAPVFGDPPKDGSVWVPTFEDTFSNGPAVNPVWQSGLAWGADYNAANGELQRYKAANATVTNGYLSLTATKTATGYNSAMLNTANGFTQTYGYFEIRTRLPKGKGFWPAFWLLASTKDAAGNYRWPPEIDGFEALGHDTQTIYFNRHYACASGSCQDIRAYSGPDFTTNFHVIGFDWKPDAIDFYVDDVKQYTINGNSPAEPMYMLVNLAIGGNWPGPPDATTKFPSVMLVDYIRVWKRQDSVPTLPPIQKYIPVCMPVDQ